MMPGVAWNGHGSLSTPIDRVATASNRIAPRVARGVASLPNSEITAAIPDDTGAPGPQPPRETAPAAVWRYVAPTPSGKIHRRPTPTFAVLIAAYQAERTIESAIDSAIAQTAPPEQVIVVDDGSTDATAELVARYGASVRLIRKSNGGAASAQNAGLDGVTADYVAILDADDRFLPQRLEALGWLAQTRPDLDLVTSDAYLVDARGTRVARFSAATPFATDDQRSAILRRCFPGGWPAIRRQRLVQVGGFDERLRVGYDWDCWLRLILSGSLAGMIDEPLYEYRFDQAGNLTANDVVTLRARLAVLDKARRDQTLTDAEAEVLAASMRRHERRATVADAWAGLQGGEHPRRRMLRLCCRPNLPAGLRLRMGLVAMFPSSAERLLPAQRSRRTAGSKATAK
jgi:hypothetical protein